MRKRASALGPFDDGLVALKAENYILYVSFSRAMWFSSVRDVIPHVDQGFGSA